MDSFRMNVSTANALNPDFQAFLDFGKIPSLASQFPNYGIYYLFAFLIAVSCSLLLGKQILFSKPASPSGPKARSLSIDSSKEDSQKGRVKSETPGNESLAVIGMSIKFPQDANSIEGFWNMLMQKKHTKTGFPESRMNAEAFHNPDAAAVRHRFPSLGANFLKEDIAAFDAPFFAMSMSEANQMDPMQRGLLETAYRALENAGLPMEKVAGSKTAVFTGAATDDWKALGHRDAEHIGQYAGTGSAYNMIANRVSWFFDFTGPSLNLDTACSSSLVAFHLACQSLINGDADMALVGGGNLTYNPDIVTALGNYGLLSADGRCFAFDERANGYSRGEGFAVLVLKRIKDALRDGDNIRAVVRGTGSNQDGKTPGITQPSPEAQERLIRAVYRKAGLDPGSTTYVEAHGTGTAVGDPIEARAISSALAQDCRRKSPLYIGSVKSNIGHLEAASGLAGLVKSILMLERGVILPLADLQRVNPAIDTKKWNVRFPASPIPWPKKSVRRASVNSFGFGGTNAHVILDGASFYLSMQDSHTLERTIARSPTGSGHTKNSRPVILCWSAMDEGGIGRIFSAFQKHFARKETSFDHHDVVKRLAFTLNERRSVLPWRSTTLLQSDADLKISELKFSKPIRALPSPGLGLVFTGQGAQWARMGMELKQYPVYEQSLRRAEDIFAQFGANWRLQDELSEDESHSRLDSPEFSQPLCTALQIALVDLLESFGVSFHAVVGHSAGEIVAAYSAGHLSRESSLKLSYYRGKLTADLIAKSRTPHTMLAVGTSEEQIQSYLDEVNSEMPRNEITIACYNSPSSITLSGTERAVNAIEQRLTHEKIFARKLKVTAAYHSPWMEGIVPGYRKAVKSLCPRSEIHDDERPIMVSSVSGRAVTRVELCGIDYWIDNLVRPVKFSQALTTIISLNRTSSDGMNKSSHPKGFRTVTDLLEIGPHSALQAPVKQCVEAALRANSIQYRSLIIRHSSALESLLQVAGGLHARGHPIWFREVNYPGSVGVEEYLRPLADLPDYPFDHSRSYWHESYISKGHRSRKLARNPFLGIQVPDFNPADARWRHVLRLQDEPWLADHKIDGSIIFPAAGMLVMAMEAAKQLAEQDQQISGFTLSNVLFESHIGLRDIDNVSSDGVETRINLTPLQGNSDRGKNSYNFCINFRDKSEWRKSCCGAISVEHAEATEQTPQDFVYVDGKKPYKDMYEFRAPLCSAKCDVRSIYKDIEDSGKGFGPAFQSLYNVAYNRKGEAIADISTRQVDLHQSQKSGHFPYVVHPTTLDGLLQLPWLAMCDGGEKETSTMIPTRIDRLWLSNSGLGLSSAAMVKAYADCKSLGHQEAEATLVALDDTKTDVLISVDGYTRTLVRDANQDGKLRDGTNRRLFYRIETRPDPDLLSSKDWYDYLESVFPPRSSRIEFFRELRLMIILYISKALREISQSPLPEDLPYYRHRYVEWLEERIDLFNRDSLPFAPSEWKRHLQDESFLEALSERVRGHSTTGKFYVTVCQSLVGVLHGKIDALDLLYRDSLAKDYYEEFITNTNAMAWYPVYLDTIAHKNPSMKILEVGAGTGSFTGATLDKLRQSSDNECGVLRYASYDYTDISPSFFEKARERFSDHQHKMSFKTFDVEKDPNAQGFSSETYDLIIAGNVLHATKNIEDALRNIRKLLKPGGRLVIMEITEPNALRTSFAFGLLEGWWRAEENSRRSSPGLTESQWQEALSKSGFTGQYLNLPDNLDPECREHSCLIATAEDEKSAPSKYPRTFIVSASQCSRTSLISCELRKSLARLGVQDCEITSLHEAAKQDHLEDVYCIFLLEVTRSFLQSPSAEDFAALRTLLTRSSGFLWTTNSGGETPRYPENALATGLARALQNENNRLKPVLLALQPDSSPMSVTVSKIVNVFTRAQSSSASTKETEYTERQQRLCIDRVIEANQMNEKVATALAPQTRGQMLFKHCPPVRLGIGRPGDLDTLEFHEDEQYTQTLGHNDLEIRVRATGMNFRDPLVALGRIPTTTMGFECAGIVTRVGKACHDFKPGDRVCANVSHSYATFVRGNSIAAIHLPPELSFAEGAALPNTMLTVYYALHYLARMRKGESILIHAGAGGTGQAAIQMATLLDADIFVTVGSKEKKRLIMELYNIPEENIFYSRNTSFAKAVQQRTNGRGVDVILNSLSGDALIKSWECVAPFGRFLELGKKDILSRNQLPMLPFSKNASFHAIDLAYLYQRPELFCEIRDGFMDLLSAGKIRPAQPLHVYGVGQIEQAFRYLQSGKNTGKTVIEMRDDDTVTAVYSTKPAYSFDERATYLISGGLGGLGRSIARWMVSRGAKNLVLLSRFGPRNQASNDLVTELKSNEVRIETPACDVADSQSLKTVLQRVDNEMPPIKGCINASMLLKDTVFEQMTLEQWKESLAPKLQGSCNLHELLPQNLDFFILLSSVSGIIGAASSANYAAGNTYQDALARYRIGIGERATSLDLGMMIEEGVLKENEVLRGRLSRTGYFMGITQKELFALLDHYCDPSLGLQAPLNSQVIVGIETLEAVREQGLDPAVWMTQRPFWNHFYQMSTGARREADTTKQGIDYAGQLTTTSSVSEAAEIVTQGLTQKLSRALAVSEDDFDLDKPLHVYGVDSLVAVELRNWISRDMNADVAIFDILGKWSFKEVGVTVAKKSLYVKAK